MSPDSLGAEHREQIFLREERGDEAKKSRETNPRVLQNLGGPCSSFIHSFSHLFATHSDHAQTGYLPGAPTQQ